MRLCNARWIFFKSTVKAKCEAPTLTVYKRKTMALLCVRVHKQVEYTGSPSQSPAPDFRCLVIKNISG